MTGRSDLGPYVAGEVAEPWVHTFADFDGMPIPLDAGTTPTLTYRLGSGLQVVRAGSVVSAPNGQAGYVWTAADLVSPGWLGGELAVVATAGGRLVRRFSLKVLPPLGGPLPAI